MVQLFNAVRQQQMDIDKKLGEAGPLERKREKVLKNIDKRAFLDVLMGGTKSIIVDDSKIETKTENYGQEVSFFLNPPNFIKFQFDFKKIEFFYRRIRRSGKF